MASATLAGSRPYKWRGRTYKTTKGLEAALLKAYPGGEPIHEAQQIALMWADGSVLLFPMQFTPKAQTLVNEPKYEPARNAA